jgi:hypothetical protein
MITIFCEKIGVFFKNQCYQYIFAKLTVHSLGKNANIFADFYGENILKIIT